MGDVPIILHIGVINAVANNRSNVSDFGPAMYFPRSEIASFKVRFVVSAAVTTTSFTASFDEEEEAAADDDETVATFRKSFNDADIPPRLLFTAVAAEVPADDDEEATAIVWISGCPTLWL